MQHCWQQRCGDSALDALTLVKADPVNPRSILGNRVLITIGSFNSHLPEVRQNRKHRSFDCVSSCFGFKLVFQIPPSFLFRWRITRPHQRPKRSGD